MKLCLFFVLLFVYDAISDSGNDAEEEEANRKKILEQLTKTRTVLLDGYHLVSRQVATDVYMYRSYRTVSVVFYPVMRDVTDARFLFQAEELHLNNIGSCEPKDVVVNIKHGSYPAVNPDGYSFPENFIDPAARELIHTIEFKSDGINKTYSIENPKPGNWYGLAYIKYEDPRTQKVEQQGIVPLCQTILYSDLQVKRAEVDLVDCFTGFSVGYNDVSQDPAYFKCISLDDNEAIRLNVSFTNVPAQHKKLAIRIQALSIPTDTNNILACALNPTTFLFHTITFYPNPNAWHYITISPLLDGYTKIADCESYYRRFDLEEVSNTSISDLMRDDKGRFFTFEYGLPTTDLQEATSLLNLTSSAISSVRFKVNQFMDVGGTFAIEASLLMSLKYYMGYRRQSGRSGLLAFSEENQFFRVVICKDIGHTSVPLASGHCKYNDVIKPALFILNSTDSESIYEKTIIPFPESGTWYLSIRLFCDDIVCPCRTSDNGTKYYVDTEFYNRTADDSDSEIVFSNETRQGVSDCNATVLLSLTSTSCVGGKCQNNGNCMLNTFGGLVMSFCSCSAGYGGWDCSDDSRMDSRIHMLAAVLLLTLSNLLFFFTVYAAVIRWYYTEAVMYGFAMVFSTFYHACDAPIQVAYCLTRGSLLQYGDFYCGIMSFWVTLLAMSVISSGCRSSLQLLGAIMIALLTTWNMYSAITFLIPVIVGCIICFSTWYIDYRRTKEMSYSRRYYTTYFPIGTTLVVVGLLCFAFLQTEQNYKIVHSIWHMAIAVSVVFLLPDKKRGPDANPFVPTPGVFNCSEMFKRAIRRSHNSGPVTEQESDES